MARYDTDVKWDDPFEHRAERRVAPRFSVPMRIKIGVDNLQKNARLVGPGQIVDISRTGARVHTRHRLKPSQRVSVCISTKLCERDAACLPAEFTGSAEALRVQDAAGGVTQVALRFGSEFSQNMEFDMFMDSLQLLSAVASA